MYIYIDEIYKLGKEISFWKLLFINNFGVKYGIRKMFFILDSFNILIILS